MKYRPIILLLIIILISTIFIDSIYMVIHKKDEDFVIDEEKSHSKHLAHFGFCIYTGALSPDEADLLKNECIKGDYKEVKESLLKNEGLNEIIENATDSTDYQFQDYIWIIQKSSVHTCHRDNNGDFFNEGQKYPSYTMLVYLEDMEKCLGVIPKSHMNKYSHLFNFNGSLKSVLCKKGDAIIFNANLIHVGTINEKEDNIRVQLKVTHKDDISKITYYEDFNKVLNQENTNPLYLRKFQRNISCMFPGFSNLTQTENIRSARGSDNGVDIGYGQQIFSYLFYGNKDFYDLPNAF